MKGFVIFLRLRRRGVAARCIYGNGTRGAPDAYAVGFAAHVTGRKLEALTEKKEEVERATRLRGARVATYRHKLSQGSAMRMCIDGSVNGT